MSENTHPFIKYTPISLTEKDSLEKSLSYYHLMNKRRSVRQFSNKPVSKKIIENIILTASSAPSGAHKQPWTFCVVSNAELKSRIRELAENEEKISYEGRMSDSWIRDLEPLGTTWMKEFIDIAPWVIIVMKKAYGFDENGEKLNYYYVNESVGIACGFLITAIHNAGLVTLTHTPSPMNFLTEALNRPANERPYLLMPVGYPDKNALVPDLKRKDLSEVVAYYE
jgi:iodotyrosine deiodinase